MKRLLFLFLAVALVGCDCFPQIPNQFYFANDSCEFYLPDYSQVIEVRDNCCVEGFVQVPHSGTRLIPGHDITVTLTAIDCAGNTSTMTFDVIVIDKIPPTFYYDSTQFLPMGQYQNEERIFKLYVTLDSSSVDTLGVFDYQTYYKNEKDERPIQTNIIDDGYKVSTLDDPNDWRGQIFTAPGNFKLSKVRLKLSKTGYLNYQNVIVELMEVDGGLNPVGDVLSRGMKGTRELFSDPAGAWYSIPMRPTTIYQGQEYAIIVRLDTADPEHTIQWRINETGLSGGFAIWTNDGPNETGNWLKDYSSDRLFEIWGEVI